MRIDEFISFGLAINMSTRAVELSLYKHSGLTDLLRSTAARHNKGDSNHPKQVEIALFRRHGPADGEDERADQIEQQKQCMAAHLDALPSQIHAAVAHSIACRPVFNVGFKVGAYFGE